MVTVDAWSQPAGTVGNARYPSGSGTFGTPLSMVVGMTDVACLEIPPLIERAPPVESHEPDATSTAFGAMLSLELTITLHDVPTTLACAVMESVGPVAVVSSTVRHCVLFAVSPAVATLRTEEVPRPSIPANVSGVSCV